MQRPDPWLHDASGSLADLGVFVPIVAALVVRNGMDPGTVLVGAGALYLAAGLYFRVPVPVQPIKAAAAIAIARGLSPATIGAAGLVLGVCLTLLALTGAWRWLARAFTVPIVRGIQLGVGLILLRAAGDLAGAEPGILPLVVAGSVGVALFVSSRATNKPPAALMIVLLAALYAVITGDLPPIDAELWSPVLNRGAFDPDVMLSALVLLVIPQIPLTFANAVIAVDDLEHRYFPLAAHKVSPGAMSLSSGIANIAAGTVGGMPMCHGSGGLTAHYRAGARTYRMNLMIGGALLAIGLFLGPTALALFALVPVAVLAGFLAFTGLFHASLAASLRGSDLVVALTIGGVGLITTNLAAGLATGLLLDRTGFLLKRRVRSLR